MNITSAFIKLIRIGAFLLLINETAVANLCRYDLGDRTLTYISQYDLQPLYKDPIGPFQIETIFQQVRTLLGNSSTPRNIAVKIVSEENQSIFQNSTSQLTLKIGYRFDSPAQRNSLANLTLVAQGFADSWIQLNWGNAPRPVKDFLVQTISIVYTKDPRGLKSLHPVTHGFWNLFAEKIMNDSNFRRTIIPRLVALLKANPELKSEEEILRLIKELN